MEGGDVLALVVALGAVAAVFFITKKQEAQTAMQAANIATVKSHQGLTGNDVIAVGATAVASYYGGPAAGSAVFKASGERL